MALPISRNEFKKFCLRKLGAPVIEINVSDEQIDDRVSEALSYYATFHFDGTEKQYYKHQITANNIGGSVYSLTIDDGGTLYSNTDTLVFTGAGANAAGTITTNSNGTITAAILTNNGKNYPIAPSISIQTSTGSNASITATLGGFVEIPDNIIGVVNLFDLTYSGSSSSSNLFGVQYQLVSTDILAMNPVQLAPYYITMQNIRVIEEILSGKQPLRYNRNSNRLYVDVDWAKLPIGSFLIVEAYEVIDPEKFKDVWKDPWLIRYSTALIKEQWGNHLKKYNTAMLGGLTFNGQQIYDEARQEIKELEYEMVNTYSLPSSDFIG